VAGFDAAANVEVTRVPRRRAGTHRERHRHRRQQVEAAAAGTVRTLAAGRAIGVALTTATTGNLVQVALNA
jgi:hypothetical protein